MILEIPEPDFLFEEVVKQRAKEVIKSYIGYGSIVMPYLNQKGKINIVINENLLELNKTDQVIFLTEIISSIAALKAEFQNSLVLPPHKAAQIIALKNHEEKLFKFDEIQFFLYNKLNDLGFKVRKDVFDVEEISDLNSKIDEIINALERVEPGQEVIFNYIEELKDDFESLKSDYLSGKKRWYQKLGGILLTYSGEKGIDEIFALIKPLLNDLWNHTPRLVEGFKNFLRLI